MEKTSIDSSTKLIIIGGSAGSLDVLLHIVPSLKKTFSIPIVIVVHRKIPNDTVLPNLLSTKTHLLVKEIEEKERIQPGSIYIVPGDYHVLIENDHTFSLDYSEKVNFSRPSIDVVFQSAANVFRQHLVCILVSGANADGTEGMQYVQQQGGTTIAQLPSSAEVAYMPEQAILHNAAHYVLDLSDMADFLNKLD